LRIKEQETRLTLQEHDDDDDDDDDDGDEIWVQYVLSSVEVGSSLLRNPNVNLLAPELFF